MGMAGGQETVGMAQTRPRASSAGTTSCGARVASRMVHRGSIFRQFPGQGRKVPGSVFFRRGTAQRAGRTAGGDGLPQAVIILRRVLRREHQHEVARVGILALDAMLPQHLGQCLTGIAQRGGIQRQLERLPVRGIPG